MKKIEERLNEEIAKIETSPYADVNFISMTSDLAKAVFKNACLNYTKEAIEKDRLNLLEYIKLKGLYHRSLDKDSIINAPNIELL